MEAIEISHIIAFLRGELPEKKQKQIQQKIEQDAHYAQEIDQYRKLMDGFNYMKDEQQQLYAFKTMEIDLLDAGETKELLEVELIENYLNGFVNEPALTWFEKRMTTDATFKTKVDDYRILFNGFKTVKKEETLAVFETLEKKIQEEAEEKPTTKSNHESTTKATAKTRFLGRWVKWAAAVAVGMFFLTYSSIQIMSHGSKIYADTYLAPSDDMDLSVDHNLEKMKILAMSIEDRINDEDYDQALDDIQKYEHLFNQTPLENKQELEESLKLNKVMLYEKLGKKDAFNKQVSSLKDKELRKKLTSPWRTIAKLLGI